MRNTKLWTIAWVTALATASPVAAAPALGATTETYLVYTEHGRKAPANVQPLANYGTAVLAPLSASDAAELASQGFRITRLEDPTWIRLPGHSFDTRAGEPALPDALRATATDARAPYLVQFVGPLHPMWRQQVSDAGGTFARYGHVNNNAWVVSMDGTAAAAVSQQPFVRWLGHYHPAFKISAELTEIAMRNDADPEAEPISVLLQVYAAADISRAIQDVKSQGGTVHAWGPDDPNSRVQPYLTAEVKPSEIARLAALPEVAWLQQRPVFELLTEQAAQSMQSGACGLACTSRTVDDVPWWRDGLTGAGPAPSCGATAGTEQIIGVMDSGIEAHTDFEACPGPGCTILAVESQISAGSCGNAAPVSSCTDLDGHGTSVSGIISGSGAVSGGELPVESCSSKGLAFGGRLDVEVCGPNLECLNACDPNLTLASFFQRTYGRGSRMSNHSWGADLSGAYDALAQTVDTWAWDNNGAQPGTPQEYLWAFAAGNAGPWPGTIGSPGTAKDVLAVAAVYNGLDGSCWSCDSLPCTDCDKLVCYSSRGPTQDGRHGPHIAGLSQCITAPDLFGGYNACFNGTSAATPTVTATAAQVRDWWIHEKGVANPSGSLVKAALLNSGEPIQDPATTVPDEAVGWGRVQLDNLWDSADPDLNVLWLDETNGVTTGGLSQFTFAVRSGNRPLRAMLVWMDYPATAGVGGLVNDLDLFVREPNDAACYRGNDATGNESNPVSCAAPGVFDGTNNDEGVRVSNPVPGRWTVEVRAANVPNGPQPFALVIGGDVVQCESPPPAPIGVGAAPAGPNSMTVSWNPVAGADRYYVYRSDGACPGTQFQFVGSTLGPSTSFTDVDLSGGSSYSYYVQALTPDSCISEASTCADAVATGDCTLPPTFAGLESVVDDDTAACGLTLGWAAAISNCPLFPTMTYNVYRSTDPAFVPGPETLRDTCASGTSYNDSEVSDGVTYYYAVRAEDSRPSGGTGDCQGGNQESNAVRRSGSPTSNDYVAGVFHDDGGDTGRAKLIADDPWYVTSLKNHTPGGLKAYRAGDTITQNCAALTTPVLRLDPAASSVLTFWTAWDIHWWQDLGVVEISTDGGGNWSRLTPATGYPKLGGSGTCVGADTAGYGNVNFAEPTLDWIEQTIDLSAYQGQDVIVRFLYATDPSWVGQGWWIDDVTVTGVLLPVTCTNPSPTCSAPPDFDGARAVSRDGGATCSLTVSWDPAQSRCTLYSGITYSVYRGTDPDFVPDASNRVASCVTETSWSDPDVFFGRNYYYVVQAEDSAPGGSGPCNGGNEDPNLVRIGSTPGGPSVPGVWTQDAGDLESQQMLLPNEWSITDLHNGTVGVSQGHSYWASTLIPYPGQMCSSMTTPPIELGVGSTLSFRDYEALDYYLLGPDGGIVEVSADGGWTWERINDSSNSTGFGYDYCAPGGANPSVPMFTNWILDWRDHQIPIPAILDNKTVQFRFRFVSDDFGGLSNLYEGWFLDDIAVDNVQAPTTCQNPDPACDVPPVFTGAVAAVNDASTNPCSVTVSWAPAEVTCGAFPANTYSIYRGTDPSFAPGPSNRIATCLTGTSYVDTEVGYGQTFYYAVRAEDSSTNGGGPCNGGNQEDNSFLVWAVPTGPSTVLGTWLDDAGDTYAPAMSVPPEWQISTYNNHTPYGATSYQSAKPGSTTYEGGVCASITSPPLTLGTDSVLSFWSWDRMDISWVDAGIIEVSNDGGITWTKVSPYQPGGWNNYPITTPGGGNDCIGAYQRAFGGFDLGGWNQWFVELGGYLPPWAPGTFPLYPGYSGQTIQFRFRFGSKGTGPQIGEGWFIDDIQVTNVWLPEGCLNSSPTCADPPVFRGVSGTSTGTNPCSVTVQWDPATAGCTSNPAVSYNVYKSRAPDFVPGPENLVSSCQPGTSFTDNDVSFDIPEYYVARAEDSGIGGSGVCNSGIEEGNVRRAVSVPQGPGGSLCLNSMPTCADPPVFPGLQAVTNNETDPCSVSLSWSAAGSRCLVGNDVTYSVYRSTTPGFTPSWQNRIASCVNGTNYADTTAYGDGSPYYYVVQSEDATINGQGACNSGNLDSNTVELFVTPSGAVGTLFFDDFESGLGNWTGTSRWVGSTAQALSGTQSAMLDDEYGVCESLAMATPVMLPADGSAFLSLWTRFEFMGPPPEIDAYNVGVVQISADDGPWTTIEPIAGYPNSISPYTDACTALAGTGFGSPDVWTRYEWDLLPYVGRSVRIRFLFGSDPTYNSINPWYIDDVEIRAGAVCSAACASLPASPAVSATTTAPETIDLDWNPVGGAVRYEIYRGAGNCSVAVFDKIASVPAPSTTHLDALAGGGGDWSYRVTAVDAAGCESAPSVCVSAAVAGTCSVPPSFAGLQSAGNTFRDPCSVRLDWSAARNNCPTAGGVTYAVYRDTSPGFTPGPANLVAACVTGTSFEDFSADSSRDYSYIVRAEDTTFGGGGPCNGGNEETNGVEWTARATGSLTPGTFLDSAGDGFPQRMVLEGSWNITLDRAYSGSASYNSGASTDTCIAMTTPEIQLDFDATSELTFWSSMNTNDERESSAMVDISIDGGATWAPLDLTPGTNIWNTFIACLPFEQHGYEGYHPSWTQYSASLVQYQGRKIVIRFHYGTRDPNDVREGWSIDDIRITNVMDDADGCSNAAPSCTAPPVFDGVKSVTDDGAATCGITVAWDPATSACGQYPDLVYNVYRGTDPDFVPGPANLVASCLETTGYADLDVDAGNPYYYAVRAEDRRIGGGGGTCGTGLEDRNTVKLGAAPSQQPPVLGTWFDDAGDSGVARMIANPMWTVSSDDAHSPPKSYFAPNDNDRCDNLVTPPLTLGSGSMLSFWSDFEGPADAWLWAAGTIEVTNDGGASWTRVAPVGGYPEYYNNNILCDLAWEDSFGAYYPWAPWSVDLSAYADQTVQIRFHFTSHNFFPDPTIGWHVDDIEVTNVWLPGGCTTQAGCKLAVDVVPDASPTTCTGNGITFSAAVSGGTSPFAYQWTEDGIDIPGATDSSHTVSRGDAASHAYNCRVNDSSPSCGALTDPVDATGEWTAQCAPNVVVDAAYDPAGSLVEVCGDGDSFVEPGERWSALARLRNAGTAVAGDVRAGLATNPASTVDAAVVSGAVSFGDIDPGLSALNFAERFEFCPATTGACGSEITFDIDGVTWTGGGTPPADFPFVLQVPLGVSDPGGDQWADLTPSDPLDATLETVISDLQTVIVGSPDTAVLSYGFSYSPPRVTVYEDDFDTVVPWDESGPVIASAEDPDTCPGSPSGFNARLGPGASLTKYFTTPLAQVRMEFDHSSDTSLDAGEFLWAEYMIESVWIPVFQGPDGGDGLWTCDESVTFPDPNSFVGIRFGNNANEIGENTRLDYFRLTGLTDDTWTDAVRVEIQDMLGTWHLLKDYGAPDAGLHDLLALGIYSGPGMYRIRLSENAGGAAQLSTVAPGEGLHVVRNPVSECDVSACCAASTAPPPVGDGWIAGGSPATFARNGDNVTYTYDSATCSEARAVVVYGNIGDYSTYVGTADCDGDGTFDATGLGDVWFNLIWVDAANMAGHPGYGSSGPRGFGAAGFGCGIVLDNIADGICD